MTKIKLFIAVLLISLLCPQLVLGQEAETIACTNNRSVLVEFIPDEFPACEVTHMDISIHPTEINWLGEELYVPTKQMELPEGPDGERCVYVKYKNAAGTWGDKTGGCIMLNRAKPMGTLKVTVFKIELKIEVEGE